MIDKFKILLPDDQSNNNYIFFDTPTEEGSYEYIWINRHEVSLEKNSVGSDILLDKSKYIYNVCKKGDDNFNIIMEKAIKFLDKKIYEYISTLKHVS